MMIYHVTKHPHPSIQSTNWTTDSLTDINAEKPRFYMNILCIQQIVHTESFWQ